jgi:hypothetical protein
MDLSKVEYPVIVQHNAAVIVMRSQRKLHNIISKATIVSVPAKPKPA